MKLAVLSGSANAPLARAVASELGVAPVDRESESFPDGERHVEILSSVRGADVYVVQPTGPPVADNLLELLLLADACRRAGASRLTAVVSYFGYARQERRARGREPIAARLVADLVAAAGFDRIVALDLHDPALEGFMPIPVEHLTATKLLAEAARPLVGEQAVVVGPDLGATKLAERFATMWAKPVAVVHKLRSSGEKVRALRVIGDVAGKAPVIVDDMISTAGTVVACAEALERAGCVKPMVVVATHGLLVGEALERLRGLELRALFVTDSLAVDVAKARGLPLRTVSVAKLLAEAISRMNREESLRELLVHV